MSPKALLPSPKARKSLQAPSTSSDQFMVAKLQSYKEQIALANDRLIDSVTKVTELLRAN